MNKIGPVIVWVEMNKKVQLREGKISITLFRYRKQGQEFLF